MEEKNGQGAKKTTPAFSDFHNILPNLKKPSGMKLEDLTYKIIGCAMSVHNSLHSGFPEIIYQRALATELKMQGLNFDRERPVAIYYKGVVVGYRRADFFVEEKVLVELKAISKIETPHIVQTLNYLNAYDLPVALLINFGGKSLEYKRIYKLRN